MSRVTLQQIADATGVTRAAVSLALRSHPSISEATRLRIVECAKQLGYRPNPLISALMSDLRTHRAVKTPCTLAYATPFSTKEMKGIPSARRYFEGARRQAVALGYRLDFFYYSEDSLPDSRMGRVLFARGITGVLLSPCRPPVSSLSLPWQHLSAATLGYTLKHPALNRSVNHQFHTINLAIQKACEFGYRRVGLLSTKRDELKVEHIWQSAILSYQAALEVADRVPIGYMDLDKPDSLRQWLDHHRPDVVLVTQEAWLDRIKSVGYRIPADVAAIMLDRSEEHVHAAGIDQRPDIVGEAGVDLVIQGLIANRYGVPSSPRTVLIEGEWVDGASLPYRQDDKPPRRRKKPVRKTKPIISGSKSP